MSAETPASVNGDMAGTTDEKIPLLTERQIELIQETWKLVAQDLEGAGMVMFLK